MGQTSGHNTQLGPLLMVSYGGSWAALFPGVSREDSASKPTQVVGRTQCLVVVGLRPHFPAGCHPGQDLCCISFATFHVVPSSKGGFSPSHATNISSVACLQLDQRKFSTFKDSHGWLSHRNNLGLSPYFKSPFYYCNLTLSQGLGIRGEGELRSSSRGDSRSLAFHTAASPTGAGMGLRVLSHLVSPFLTLQRSLCGPQSQPV